MSGPVDSLVRVRRLLFDRSVAETARATTGARKARDVLEAKTQCLASIERRREEVSDRIQVLHDARWLAQIWVIDRLLEQDLQKAREEVDLAEDSLSRQRENLSKRRGDLARAQAKLSVAHSLGRQHKKAARRRRERLSEPEVSGIRTRCL